MSKASREPSGPKAHLSDEEILVAMEAHQDLPDHRQRHLAVCPACRAETERIGKQLNNLGKLVRQHTPLPGARVRLPEESGAKRGAVVGRPWFKPAAAMLAVVSLVLLALLWHPTGSDTDLTPRPQVANGQDPQGDLDDALALMESIQELIDNPLPGGYREMAAAVDLPPEGYDMDFLVPPVEDADPGDSIQKEDSA